MIGFLGIAAALEEQQQAFVPGRLSGPHDGFDPRPDIRPDFGPDLVCGTAEGRGVLDAKRRDIGVVAEKGEVLPPRHPHLVARCHHDAQDCCKALRPTLARPETGCCPVGGSDEGRHFATAGREGCGLAADLLAAHRFVPGNPASSASSGRSDFTLGGWWNEFSPTPGCFHTKMSLRAPSPEQGCGGRR